MTTPNNQVHAATETINGQEYVIFDVYAATPLNDIITFCDRNPYVKLVLRENRKTNTHEYWGAETSLGSRYAKIIDLNGYTLAVSQWELNGGYLEIRDTSVAQTGQFICTGTLSLQVANQVHFRSGTIQAGTISYFGAVYFWGGKVECTTAKLNAGASCQVAPEMQATYDENGAVLTCRAKPLMVDGVEYRTIYIPGDSDPTLSRTLINNGATSTGNYRFILMDEWDLVANKLMGATYGTNIIFDLNGHVIRSNSVEGSRYYLNFYVDTFELTDSSTAGTGSITICALQKAQKVIFSGGGSYAAEVSAKNVAVIIRGGKSVRFSNWQGDAAVTTWTVAPYMKLTGSTSTTRAYAPVGDYFAVSDSPFVAGIYNYEMGYVWDLTVGALWGLSVPADKMYYLWARNGNGAYEYLNIVYRDGEWVRVDSEISVA